MEMTRRKAILRTGFPALLALLLFAADVQWAWADPGVAPDAPKIMVADTFPQIWRGTYEMGQEQFRGAIGFMLFIGKATFTWASCIHTKMLRIADSEKEFVFQIDPKTKCGYAGWIMRLRMPITNDNGVIAVDQYRTKDDFETGKLFVHYDFERVEK